MNKVKQQHYVPQFYLRKFTDPEDRIHVFDKQNLKSYETTPRNVAGERYFYDSVEMEELFGDKQTIEKYLSRFEQDLAPKITNLIDKLDSNDFVRLHPETRFAISIFASLQSVRGKEQRLTFSQMNESLLNFLKKNQGTEDLVAEIEGTQNEESQKNFHAKHLLNIDIVIKIAQIIESHIWTIQRACPGIPFWTSDQPIVRKENVHDEFRSNSGFASPGIEIHIPLSPLFMVVCYERAHFSDLSPLDGKVIDIKSERDMHYYQHFQILNSIRFLYSTSNNFDIAAEMCEKEPDLKDPQRKRVVSNHDEEYWANKPD